MSLRDKLRILVVDDMSVSRGLLTQGLDELGVVNYIVENDGKAAFKRFATKPVHLVLSDFNMPGLDGLGLLSELRSNQATRGTAFILVTGSPTPEVVERGRALRVNFILKKPFTTQQLKGAIEAVMGQPL